MGGKKVMIGVRVDPELWARFGLFCKANKVTIEHSFDAVLRTALERFGIPPLDHPEGRGLEKVIKEKVGG